MLTELEAHAGETIIITRFIIWLEMVKLFVERNIGGGDDWWKESSIRPNDFVIEERYTIHSGEEVFCTKCAKTYNLVK